MGKSAIGGKSPVLETWTFWGKESSTEHEKFRLKMGGPPPKAKYYLVTDRAQYREGTVKRTPGGE